MTTKTFSCEENSNVELNVFQFDEYVEISITNENQKINFSFFKSNIGCSNGVN